jgi:hypothetical protein
VLNGESIEEHGNQKDEHDHRDDHNGWARSGLRLFLDDGHARIVPRRLGARQPSTRRNQAFLTVL